MAADNQNDADREAKALTVGGALDALIKASIPAVAKETIASLVLGAGKAGASWLAALSAQGEHVANDIGLATVRARIEAARSLVSLPEADETAALVVRSLVREAAESLRKQENLEGVGAETVELLREAPPRPETPPVDQDWLNIFSGIAEKASSARLRKHLAAVLAGEIRKPGTVSLRSLQILSVVDQSLAGYISRFRARVMSGCIPLVQEHKQGDDYTGLLHLNAAGLITMGHARIFGPDASTHPFVYYEVGKVPIFVKFPPRELRLSASILTTAGVEIFDLVPPAADIVFAQQVADHFRQAGAPYAGLSPPHPADDATEAS